MNTESSRSHSIFVYNIQQKSSQTGTIKTGRLYLVDLAGSEKVGKTGASGQTLEEAKKINRSLSALGMVINALTDGKSAHVPYRDSKLTRILQESLGGNSRTTLIVNCSPCGYNLEETVSTLRFGVRAKSIKNNAHVNAELSPEELRAQLRRANEHISALRDHAAVLRGEITRWRSGQSVPEAEWSNLDTIALRHDVSKNTQAPVEFPDNEESDNEQPLTREVPSDPAVDSLRAELDYVRVQEATLMQRNRGLAAELSEARVQIDELASEHQEACAKLEALQNGASAGDNRDDSRTPREERTAQVMSSLDARAQTDLGSALATFSKLEASATAAGVSPADVHSLRQAYVQANISLGEQTQRTRKHEQENEVLLEQKQAMHDRLTALQQRFDLITDRLSALEYSTRPGDDSSEQINALRTLLEEQSASFREDENSEVSQLQKLLSLRGEETAVLARSLDELRASHEEQKNALSLLSQAPQGPGRIDPDLVRRLVHASSQMEQAREVVALRLQEYDSMKRDLMDELRTRSERLVEMEMSLEEMQEQYRTLAEAMNLRTQQKKMAILEKHLEQITGIQRELVAQNTMLKKDMAASEKKIASRDGRITMLEDQLASAASTRAATPVPETVYVSQPAATTTSGMQSTAVGPGAAPAPAPSFGRIAKPIRGGGAAVGNAGNAAANPNPPPRPKGSWFFAAK